MAFFGFRRKETAKPTSGSELKGKKDVVLGKKKSEREVSSTKKDVKAKKKVSAKISKSAPQKTQDSARSRATDYSNILVKPRITEKAAVLAEEGNVYTFNVHPKSTKKEVAKAVEDAYKVVPVKVNITQIKRKTVMRRGKRGKTAGGKKAMVYLRDGDKIEFV